MTAAHDTQALTKQARELAFSMTHSAGQWMVPGWDGYKVAHLLETIASRLQEQEGQPALSEKEAFMRTLGWQPPATLAAGSQAVQVPGWQWVPVEPTAEMLQAGQDAQNRAVYAKPQPAGAQWGGVYYRAMVQAAPIQPLAGGEVL